MARPQVGSDDEGYAVRLKLKHFLRYCSQPGHAPADDSPLYVFAHLDREREEGRALLKDYQGGWRETEAGPGMCRGRPCSAGAGLAGGRARRHLLAACLSAQVSVPARQCLPLLLQCRRCLRRT